MEEREDIVVLVDENGEEAEFIHLDTFNMNENIYVVLLPAEDEEDEEAEVVIFKLDEDEEGEEVLSIIEDEDELLEAFDEFQMRYNEDDDFDDFENMGYFED